MQLILAVKDYCCSGQSLSEDALDVAETSEEILVEAFGCLDLKSVYVVCYGMQQIYLFLAFVPVKIGSGFCLCSAGF